MNIKLGFIVGLLTVSAIQGSEQIRDLNGNFISSDDSKKALEEAKKAVTMAINGLKSIVEMAQDPWDMEKEEEETFITQKMFCLAPYVHADHVSRKNNNPKCAMTLDKLREIMKSLEDRMLYSGAD